MDTHWSWEQRTLIDELVQGRELSKRLKAELGKSPCVETADFLVQKILGSLEKALLLLRSSGSGGQVTTPCGEVGLQPESPVSVNGSPQTEDFDKGYQEHNEGSKKRKTASARWIEQVKVSCETGLEGPRDDGYSWRKYGQKDILGAKYPRSYYRCTFRNTQNCWATKQVQRSDEDPTMFEITYRGSHSCFYGNTGLPAPASPGKRLKKETHHHNTHTHLGQMRTSLQNRLSVNTDNLEAEEMACYPFAFPSTSFGCIATQTQRSSVPFQPEPTAPLTGLPPSILSPATPESNYLAVLPAQITHFGPIDSLHRSGSDLTEIISATTSASNSPIPHLDFPLDPVQIYADFPFDSPELFS